jgi:CheY-like chemotaxis protein
VAQHAKSVLIVDDDRDVLEVMASILAEAGFDVAQAPGGMEAMSTIIAGKGFDLLLTDVRMPGSFDGFTLARAARRHLPDLAVIYVSGWIEILPDSEHVLGPLLTKPVLPATLCRTVEQMLRAA